MSKKRNTQYQQQMNLFEGQPVEKPSEDIDEEYSLDDDFGIGVENSTVKVETVTSELITLKLLREAIKAQNPNDPIMADFAEFVLPQLQRVAIGTTAKGGKYMEKKEEEYYARKEQERLENKKQGKDAVVEVFSRRSSSDQSLNAHLLNGLFPANLIEQRLEKLDTTLQRVIRTLERRIGIAGFILHDYEKFNYSRFPSMPKKYVNKDKILDRSLEEHREILDVIIRELKLDCFINPENPEDYQKYLDDLLFIAYNTQTRNNTNLNTSKYGLNKLSLNGKQLDSLTNLSRLADLLASIIKHPQDAENSTLKSVLHQLSDGQIEFTYHKIAENHGVLSNIVNNAVMDEYISINTEECKYYEPLLYLPTGVIYLKYKNAPQISTGKIPERVIQKIKALCMNELKESQKGFVREGKGMKYAEYYELFFDDFELMKIGLDATKKFVRNSKADDRSNSLLEFQKKGTLSSHYDFKFSSDVRIDQLGEFGDLITRKIWGSRVKKVINEAKKNKQKPQANNLAPEDQLILKIAEFLELQVYIPQIKEIQRINEALKELKLKGNTGGLPLEWYYLAAQYIKHHPGMEDIKEIGEQIIACIGEIISPILSQYQSKTDGWDDLRSWVKSVVMLPSDNQIKADKFLEELTRYNSAKQAGRGKQLVCSITHAAYTVTEQMESSVLFTPQVYTNKQMLGGSNAKRNISSIAGMEFMLRQILMSSTQEVGKGFEDKKYRYIYFYPTYYFTPETNKFLFKAYDQISTARFDTSIRNHFISKESQANLSLNRYQGVDIFKINEAKNSSNNQSQETKKTQIFKLNYLENQPITFYFMGLPPEKRGKTDPTDTESWVMPSWLAFAFPMILDVKTVVSESPIPPYINGTEFEQTVFLDSPPQTFQLLTKDDYFRLDSILEGWESKQKKYSAPLNILTVAYTIHLDINAKQGKTGYNPNWSKLSELARDLETSPLYVFSYLKKLARNLNLDSPGVPKIKLYTYIFYPCFDPYVEFNSEKEELKIVNQVSSPIHHPKELTERFRKFYRAKFAKGKPTKANAILKPIDEAADVILKVDFSSCQGETLVDYVAARLFSLMNRVHSSTAEGRWVFKNDQRDKERESILEFSRYFVLEVFEKTFNGDRARLAGRQLNLIRDTCEFIYRLEDDKEWANKKKTLDDSENQDSENEE
jgi:CRISPR-associated protein Csc3